MKFSTTGLEDYITDERAEIQGITIKISDDVSFRCRRAWTGVAVYDRALSKHTRPYQRRVRNMSNSDLRERILLPTYLDAVILGWEGVKDEDGEEVPFSKEACKEFLQAFPNVFETLVDIASDMAAFRVQEQEETAEAVGES